ncbi:MAG: septum formation initiator family protein [Clostridia bacterium]|nr:septum formation initiator family protein [Clostridia bacterium]
MKNTTLLRGKIIGRICWIVVIVITVICLISQQFKINKYAEEVAKLEEERAQLQERNDELATMNELSDEDFERAAREQGYVRPDEVIIKEAD